MDMYDFASLKDIPFNPSIQILGIAITVGLYGGRIVLHACRATVLKNVTQGHS
jgi:hypothetical protein